MKASEKIQIGIIFGGRSGEHEISLRSARSIVEAIDREKYELSLIGIDHDGRWQLLDEPAFRLVTDAALPVLNGTGSEVILPPTPRMGTLIDPQRPAAPLNRLDVVFPVLHGPFGEDGTIQGLLELANVPYVGAGVLGSALGMDKDVQKRLLQAAGVPIVPFFTIHSGEGVEARSVADRVTGLGLPVFVKPANLGSSVGISKVKTLADLSTALRTAFQYDTKILVEKGIDGREIECAVLGNDDPQASVPGEICPQSEFYSYEAKYVAENGAVLHIPAALTDSQTTAVRQLAVRVFQLLDCAGMARVDFFIDRQSGTLYVNELNTIPGFTTISMFPKLWAASGVPYGELIDRLIDLALQRHAQQRRLQRAYAPPRA